MCYRYLYTIPKEVLWQVFDMTPMLDFEYGPRYNIAPSAAAPIIRMANVGRVVELMKWGLVPHWSKEPTTRFATFNARSEDAATKATYKGPMKYRRCLVPLTGFYEWRKLPGGAKQPYLITMADEQPFALAGLWDCWHDELQTFSILTTTPNEMMTKIHNRMPVVIDHDDYARWLDPAIHDTDSVSDLLRPYPAELMLARPVSGYVSNVKNEGPECVESVSQIADHG